MDNNNPNNSSNPPSDSNSTDSTTGPVVTGGELGSPGATAPSWTQAGGIDSSVPSSAPIFSGSPSLSPAASPLGDPFTPVNPPATDSNPFLPSSPVFPPTSPVSSNFSSSADASSISSSAPNPTSDFSVPLSASNTIEPPSPAPTWTPPADNTAQASVGTISSNFPSAGEVPAPAAESPLPTFVPPASVTRGVDGGAAAGDLSSLGNTELANIASQPPASAFDQGTTVNQPNGFTVVNPPSASDASSGMNWSNEGATGVLSASSETAPEVSSAGNGLSEAVPTDFSHLAGQQDAGSMSPSTAPQPETLVVPASPETTQVVSSGSAGFPKWMFIVGGLVLLLIVGGASAYFILGVGKPNPAPASPSSDVVEQDLSPAAPVNNLVFPTPLPHVASGSGSFSNLEGTNPTMAASPTATISPNAGSAIDRIRQRLSVTVTPSLAP